MLLGASYLGPKEALGIRWYFDLSAVALYSRLPVLTFGLDLTVGGL